MVFRKYLYGVYHTVQIYNKLSSTVFLIVYKIIIYGWHKTLKSVFHETFKSEV